MPITSLVLKVASRCNLNCSYCYMYNLGDTTYRNQPKIMSKETVGEIISEVHRYTQKYSIKNFQFIFHGGEPLLATLSWYEYFVRCASQTMKDIRLDYSLQTNGVLYDESWARGLKSIGVRVGFSWDGPEKIHNKFRTYRNGRGSYMEVVKGMEIHKLINGQVGGLSVINAEIDPNEYYQNVKDLGMSSFTLLLPQLHYSMKEEFKFFNYSTDDITFGKWLCELFDLWWDDPDNNKPNIHYFTDFITMILGDKKSHESFGDGENTVLVIETNGDIETSTSLKSCGNGFTKENNKISNTTLDEALDSELIRLFLTSHINLCKTCKTCKIKHICGGGRINERFSEKNGFDNPTIYCNDIKFIITHIQNRLLEDFSNEELNELDLEELKYEDI